MFRPRTANVHMNNNPNNPWGRPSGGGQNPWGSGGGNNNGGGWRPGGSGGGSGGDMPPELDEMLRKAQENLRQVMPSGFQGPRLFGLLLAGVTALWLASGFYIIVPGENGVIQRFGEWSNTKTTEGLGYRLPYPIETLTKVNVSEMRRLSVGFSERMVMGGPSQRQSVPEESLMLTSDANIVDLDMVVLWTIKSAEDYLFQIRDPESTIKKVAESAIREVVGQTLMFPLITQERDNVANRARDIMSKTLDEYKSGIIINQVLIQRAEVHPDVQDAFQDVQSAKQDAIEVQNRAGAYREDIIPKARGEAIRLKQEAEAYKQSVIARAQGDADRFNSIYQAYLTNKDVTKTRLYIETMEEVMKNAQKIIMDGEAGKSGVVPYVPLNELKPAAGSSR
ncbi:MAG: FtsH protease activity modulator HflK [Micavibrio sp.]